MKFKKLIISLLNDDFHDNLLFDQKLYEKSVTFSYNKHIGYY